MSENIPILFIRIFVGFTRSRLLFLAFLSSLCDYEHYLAHVLALGWRLEQEYRLLVVLLVLHRLIFMTSIMFARCIVVASFESDSPRRFSLVSPTTLPLSSPCPSLLSKQVVLTKQKRQKREEKKDRVNILSVRRCIRFHIMYQRSLIFITYSLALASRSFAFSFEHH